MSSYSCVDRAGQELSEHAVHDFADLFAKEFGVPNGMMVWSAGRVIYERYAPPFASNLRHSLHSATKSVLGSVVGIAIRDGHLSLDDRVADVLTRYLPKQVSPELEALTIEHLLTMRAGFARGVSGSWAREQSSGLTRALLALPFGSMPGRNFLYSSGPSQLLSASIQEVTGAPVARIAEELLFAPLGISDFRWHSDQEGVTFGGNGLSLRLSDYLAWGLLYLNGGARQGSQVLPYEWVRDSMRAHVRVDSRPYSDGKRLIAAPISRELQTETYGYHLWGHQAGFSFAAGLFGQYLFILPAQRSVLAVVSSMPAWEHNRLPDFVASNLLGYRTTDSVGVSPSPSPPRTADSSYRSDQSESGKSDPAVELDPSFLGCFQPRRTPQFLDLVSVDRRVGETRIKLRTRSGELTATTRGWEEAFIPFDFPDLHHSYALDDEVGLVRASVESSDVLVIEVQYPTTPFRDTLRLEFLSEVDCRIDVTTNVNSGSIRGVNFDLTRARQR